MTIPRDAIASIRDSAWWLNQVTSCDRPGRGPVPPRQADSCMFGRRIGSPGTRNCFSVRSGRWVPGRLPYSRRGRQRFYLHRCACPWPSVDSPRYTGSATDA